MNKFRTVDPSLQWDTQSGTTADIDWGFVLTIKATILSDLLDRIFRKDSRSGLSDESIRRRRQQTLHFHIVQFEFALRESIARMTSVLLEERRQIVLFQQDGRNREELPAERSVRHGTRFPRLMR